MLMSRSYNILTSSFELVEPAEIPRRHRSQGTWSGPCSGSLARYAQLAAAGAACAGALRHALRLLPRPATAAPPARLSRRQLRLLGLSPADLDSSLVLSEGESSSALAPAPVPAPAASALAPCELSLSLSPRRWRAPRSPPPSPPPASPPRSPSRSPPRSPPHSPRDAPRDRFIADHRSLADYLKQYEGRQEGAESAEGAVSAASACAPRVSPPPAYQLSALDSEGGKLEEGSPEGSPPVCWQLDIDPHKLTQWNLNLRLVSGAGWGGAGRQAGPRPRLSAWSCAQWIHITILERVVGAMAAADAALARLAGGEARLGRVSGERLRALAGAAPALGALLPYLEPFADQRYVVRRLRELARAPCLSEYRGEAGGADWHAGQPTDAEIILHLFATYLDGQMLQSGNPRPFTSQYVYAAGAGAEVGAGAEEPRLERVRERPPQWAVRVGGALAGARGRNNLLHALLLLLAAAARRSPPALARTPLGPAGLNMLWILS
ncbi:Transmembrane protein 209 [Papilio xuthus]|uniref:Transmembrane protein 209 n=1 Tax=Papilio xuthus TaxID=66420 RepID=A0A0N0P9G3_PAPXU|nr:Transmembrane protein 209 [Papilio xuthus]